jgi:hypothetical protein
MGSNMLAASTIIGYGLAELFDLLNLVPSSLVISSPVNKMKYIRCKWKYDG